MTDSNSLIVKDTKYVPYNSISLSYGGNRKDIFLNYLPSQGSQDVSNFVRVVYELFTIVLYACDRLEHGLSLIHI